MPAKSKSQRRLFAIALRYKLGDIEDVSDDVKELSKLPEETLRDFASTPEKGLPENLEPGSIQGMGPLEFPGDPSSLNAFGGQKHGSGDIPFQLKKKKKKLISFSDFIKNQKS